MGGRNHMDDSTRGRLNRVVVATKIELCKVFLTLTHTSHLSFPVQNVVQANAYRMSSERFSGVPLRRFVVCGFRVVVFFVARFAHVHASVDTRPLHLILFITGCRLLFKDGLPIETLLFQKCGANLIFVLFMMFVNLSQRKLRALANASVCCWLVPPGVLRTTNPAKKTHVVLLAFRTAPGLQVIDQTVLNIRSQAVLHFSDHVV